MSNLEECELKKKVRSEKGLGLIGTIFLVIIIVAVIVGTVYFVKIQHANQNLENIKTDMLLVQGKVKVISGEYTLNKKDEVLVGTSIKDMKEDEVIKSFLEKEIINIDEKNSKFYVMNNQNLQDMDLKQVILPENTYYIVNYTNNDVFITNGFVYTDGNTYYSLTKINEL